MLYPRSTGSMADNACSFVLPLAIFAICILFLNTVKDFKNVMSPLCSVAPCVYLFFLYERSVW